MIEIPYSDVIKDISIIIWPGKNPGSGWKEYGSPSLDFCGAALGTIFFCGAFRGAFCGAAPRKLYPRKKPHETDRAGLQYCCS